MANPNHLTVAIVGRPNVGKSTLYNRLTGTRHALVDDQPGVTRDWRVGEGRIGPMEFNVIDTAGLEEALKNTLEQRMFAGTEQALAKTDVVLFVIDGRAGVTPQDQAFAGWLRKTGKPVILVINKSESGAAATRMDAYGLGLGEGISISAAHGEGMGDLYEALAPWDRETEESAAAGRTSPERERSEQPIEFSGENSGATKEGPLHLAIIGRPNAGKSTLLNRLLGEDRVLTGPEAGITRDAIAVDYIYKGQPIRLVDTAGMRRKANIDDPLEKLAVGDALRVIRYAHVVVVLLDAEMALEKQDLNLIALVEREGRALVIGINKWDKIADKQEYMKVTEARVAAVIPQVKGVPIVPLSALTGERVDALLDAALKIYETWNRRVPTGELNRWLEGAITRHTPPIVRSKRIKIRYITQIKTRPPTFALFVNNSADFPDSYLRYLVNSLRESCDLPGVPVRISLRKGKNPYTDKKE